MRANIARLRADNSEHRTQRELRREIYEDARRTGKDISKTPGKRVPTEVFDFKIWEWRKVN